MKLLYELPKEARATYEKHSAKDERMMYCLPYNFEGDKNIDGYVAITDKFIYKISNGLLAEKYDFSDLTDFSVENMLGCSGFYTKVKGKSRLVCRFISGRYLPHYTLMVRACNVIANAKQNGEDPGEPFVNNEPDRYCDKCGAPLIRNTNICPNCRDKFSAVKRLWELTRGMRLMLMFPVLVSAISLIFQFVTPILQKTAINNYVAPAEGTARGTVMGFFAVVLGIVTIDIIQRILSAIQTRISSISGNRFILTLRSILFEKIQNLSISSIQKKSTGDLMERINTDVTTIQSFVTENIPNIINQVLSFVIALVVILFVNPMICLFVFLPIIPVLLFVKKAWKKIGTNANKLWKKSYAVNCLVQDTLQGERIVKSFGRENSAIESFNKTVTKRTKQAIIGEKFSGTVMPIISFLFQLGTYIILFYGNYKLFKGEFSVGDLYLFTSYTAIIYAPLKEFLNIPSILANVINAITKVMEILDEEPEVSDINLPIDIKIEGDISIENVTFGYNSYDPVLENVSVKINQGEMVGIVGSSGSGKSTLINLIMRLYDVNEGAIIIDDVNIKDISQQSLRSQIGVVLQETHLFYGSIRDNICYAKPWASNEEVIRAAKLANAHDFICNLPHGYNTIVSERGSSLSGGERQRIAIARAMIHDPRILILDEATAALDTETEKMIQDSLNTLMKGRTTIAIAHRLSTLRNADKLIVLDNGHLAEFGTHSELLKKKGIYYKLVMAQRLHAVK